MSEIPSVSLDRAEGTFLVDFFFLFFGGGFNVSSICVKENAFIQEEKTVFIVSGHMTKHSNIMQIIAN